VGPVFATGTYAYSGRPASLAPEQDRTLRSPIDAPGFELLGVVGYLPSRVFGVGGYADGGLFFESARISRTTINGAYTGSTGATASLILGAGAYTTGSVGVCHVRLLFAREDIGGDPYNFVEPEPMTGPTASLGLGWFGGALGVQTRMAYFRVLGKNSSLEALLFGFAAAVQYW
jgi:hypothetical protein